MTRRQRAVPIDASAPAPVDPSEPVDHVDHAQALTRFRRLRGRNVTLGFVAYGPVVDAVTPEELVEKVEEALVDEGKKREPS